jgi:hypothetical protein
MYPAMDVSVARVLFQVHFLAVLAVDFAMARWRLFFGRGQA